MTPREKEDKFNTLIIEGINITRLSQEGDALYKDETVINESFHRFNLWKSNIKDFLNFAEKNNIRWSVFYEADSVPLMKGGAEYGDVKTKKSQELLKNIRTETSKYLSLLRGLGEEMFSSKLSKLKIQDPDIVKLGTKKKFIFNIQTGNLKYNGLDLVFPPGQRKFNFLRTLVLAKENQAGYEEICKNLNYKNSKPARRDIQALVKDVKKEMKILPKDKNSKTDIFVNVPRVGYKLNIP